MERDRRVLLSYRWFQCPKRLNGLDTYHSSCASGSRGVASYPQRASCESLQIGRPRRWLRLYSRFSSRRAIARANRLLLGKRPKTFPSPSREGRLDSASLEEESSFSIFGHLGAVRASKRCQTWTVFKRGSAHVVVLS
jgi:hypothetical protein